MKQSKSNNGKKVNTANYAELKPHEKRLLLEEKRKIFFTEYQNLSTTMSVLQRMAPLFRGRNRKDIKQAIEQVSEVRHLMCDFGHSDRLKK